MTEYREYPKEPWWERVFAWPIAVASMAGVLCIFGMLELHLWWKDRKRWRQQHGQRTV
jgi:hypothetical protein